MNPLAWLSELYEDRECIKLSITTLSQIHNDVLGYVIYTATVLLDRYRGVI